MSSLITGIRLESGDPYAHGHIEVVQIDYGRLAWARDVAQDIDAGRETYNTEAGGQRARVRTGDCGVTSHPRYITTAPDGTTQNNLLHLPRV